MPKPPSTDAVPDVLLVLGDPRTSEPLSALLELAGYRTVAVDRGTEATALLTERRFDLVILDVTLPDTEALRHSRRLLAPDRPAVLLLTGTGEFLGSLPGGGPGADGQAGGAPGRVAEVLARARQLVRVGEPAGWDGALRYGDLVLDDATRRARRGERTIELTPAEYRLLRCLLVNAERVLSKEQIGRHVWDDPPTDGAIDRLVSRLRRKVNAEQAALIHTRRGFGYWLGRAARS
ncbi:response regulator transcription factor [Streptomyces cyaneochromogenes]|uniref:Response regulator transcription factor n=1 Tax=Streptomyces cyaneochromogenes TaxID=2496836 RepID=A0A3Q9ERH4_9ACTN|nr:response regulator transcription factor [Streptomyces cyaneochromogenes]AZQ34347.1 response regulator transcription factor [Streptomyces cyaneochromogenes]